MMLLAALAGGVSPTAAASVPSPAAGEYEVKAAFLYRFAQFVRWPDDAAKPPGRMELCLAGDNPFGDALSRLDGKTVNGKPLVVREIRLGEPLTPCHLLYIGASEWPHLGPILRASEREHVLTVADMDGFVQRGGMIGLVTLDNRVGFDIHLGEVRDAGLEISSRVLGLARQVIEDAEVLP